MGYFISVVLLAVYCYAKDASILYAASIFGVAGAIEMTKKK